MGSCRTECFAGAGWQRGWGDVSVRAKDYRAFVDGEVGEAAAAVGDKASSPWGGCEGLVLPELFPGAQDEGSRSWWKEVAGGRDDLDIVHGRGVVKHNP